MENRNVSIEAVAKALRVTTVVAELIQAAEEIPSGHLYAMVQAYGMGLREYEAHIALLVRGSMIIKRDDHMLIWIGPPNRQSER